MGLRRIMARVADLVLVVLLAGRGFNLSDHYRDGDYIGIIAAITGLFLVYEILCSMLLKKTPGKMLFGLVITNEQGDLPTFLTSMTRSLKVAGMGMGLFIPIIAPIFCLYHSVVILQKKETFWDTDYKVVSSWPDNRGTFTRIIAILFFAFGMSNWLAAEGELTSGEVVYLYQTNPIPSDEIATEGPLSQLASTFNLDKTWHQGHTKIVDEYRQKGEYQKSVDYLDSLGLENYTLTAEDYNEIGYFYIDGGAAEKGISFIEKGILLIDASNPDNLNEEETDVVDAMNVNLSWGYNILGDFEKAKSYGENSLRFEPNGIYDYMNLGDAYAGLEAYEKAIDNYLLGLDGSEESAYLLYQIGRSYYQLETYDQAVDYFKQYNEAIEDDYQGIIYEGFARVRNDESIEMVAPNLIESIPLITEPDWLYELIELFYEYEGDPYVKEAIEAGIKQFPEDLFQYYGVDYYMDKGDEAGLIDFIGEQIAKLSIEPDKSLLEADLYLYASWNRKAITLYKQLLDENPDCLEGKYGLLEALTFARDFDGVDQWEKVYGKTEPLSETNWHLADAYFELKEFSKASQYYELAYEDNKDNPDFLNHYSGLKYYEGNMEESSELINKAVDAGLKADVSQYMDMLSEQNATEGERLVTFFNEHYLYNKDKPLDETFAQSFKEKETLTEADLESFWQASHMDEDEFSFYISGEYYQQYLTMEEENTVVIEKIGENTYRLAIQFFSEKTDREFYDAMKSIKEPGKAVLILDLRGNPGGDADSAFEILDYLLPYHQTAEMTDREKESYPYYSDYDQIDFKELVVWMDHNSASSSEIVALGLNTYLDNVTLIGEKSYGKGVAQTLFYSDTNTWVGFIVTDYWHIDGQNIQGIGIEPEVTVSGDGEAYLTKTQEVIPLN